MVYLEEIEIIEVISPHIQNNEPSPADQLWLKYDKPQLRQQLPEWLTCIVLSYDLVACQCKHHKEKYRIVQEYLNHSSRIEVIKQCQILTLIQVHISVLWTHTRYKVPMEWFYCVYLEIIRDSVFVPVYHRQEKERVYKTSSHSVRTRLLVEEEMSVDLFATKDYIENLQVAFVFDKLIDL